MLIVRINLLPMYFTEPNAIRPVPALVLGEGGIKTRTTRRGSRYVRRDTHNYEPIVAMRRAHGWVVTLRIRAKISGTLRKRINRSFGEIVSHETSNASYTAAGVVILFATAHSRIAENGYPSSPGLEDLDLTGLAPQPPQGCASAQFRNSAQP